MARPAPYRMMWRPSAADDAALTSNAKAAFGRIERVGRMVRDSSGRPEMRMFVDPAKAPLWKVVKGATPILAQAALHQYYAADAVRHALHERGATQRVIAEHIGVHEGHLSKVLAGRKWWTADMAGVATRLLVREATRSAVPSAAELAVALRTTRHPDTALRMLEPLPEAFPYIVGSVGDRRSLLDVEAGDVSDDNPFGDTPEFDYFLPVSEEVQTELRWTIEQPLRHAAAAAIERLHTRTGKRRPKGDVRITGDVFVRDRRDGTMPVASAGAWGRTFDIGAVLPDTWLTDVGDAGLALIDGYLVVHLQHSNPSLMPTGIPARHLVLALRERPEGNIDEYDPEWAWVLESAAGHTLQWVTTRTGA